ncbi:MAG: dihydrolipoyl dehydrogenase [Candidatus Gracilibacteria bacterium]|nr:dihydrolipoyl dehydrogenase [Candidatus Gracilibacteria bacterium]
MKVDIVIVGAGPGGADAALLLAKAGKKVVLVEKDEIGGECLNWGCVPTKALVHAAEILDITKESKRFGIEISDAKADWQAVLAYKNRICTMLRMGLTKSLEAAGVEIVKGFGKLKDKNTVLIEPSLSNEAARSLEADYIILAAGSAPFVIPSITLSERIVTSRNIYDWPELPKSILIVGGGVIGLEFASFLNAFGVAVTIVEMLPRIANTEDEDVSAELTRIMERRGVKILTSTKLAALTEDEKGLNAKFENEAGLTEATFEKALICIGRRPAFSQMGLAEIGITVEKGVKVNAKLQTSIPNIYAIGDLTGESILAYISSAHGKIAAHEILGKEKKYNLEVFPRCIFTNPEIASCGLTEKQLTEKGIEYEVKKAMYAANGKASIHGKRDGFLKLLIEKSTDKILGAAIIGDSANLMIDKAVLAIAQGMTAGQLEEILAGHPVLSELYTAALES